MVVPKNVSNQPKEKSSGKNSKSPSPEPFREPDGMTTVDLNKSDDYSEESEIENAKLKKRAQTKYLYHLLFALGSILAVVIILITMEFINKEYHLFTVIPLKIDSQSPTLRRSTSLSEEFEQLNELLNREKFTERLKSGNYVEQFPVELKLCKLIQSMEYCCQIFKRTDLQDLSEYCTVSDVVEYLGDNFRAKRNALGNGKSKRYVNYYEYDLPQSYGEGNLQYLDYDQGPEYPNPFDQYQEHHLQFPEHSQPELYFNSPVHSDMSYLGPPALQSSGYYGIPTGPPEARQNEYDFALQADPIVRDSHVPLEKKVKTTTSFPTTEEGPKIVKTVVRVPVDSRSKLNIHRSSEASHRTFNEPELYLESPHVPEKIKMEIPSAEPEVENPIKIKTSFDRFPPDPHFMSPFVLKAVNVPPQIKPKTDEIFVDSKPMKITKKYKFPDDMIGEIERSNQESPGRRVENLQYVKEPLISHGLFPQHSAVSNMKESLREAESSSTPTVYLKSAHIPEKEDVGPSSEAPTINIKPITFKNKYNFPDDMISEIERSRPESQNSLEEPRQSEYWIKCKVEEELCKKYGTDVEAGPVRLNTEAPEIHPEDKTIATGHYIHDSSITALKKTSNIISEVDRPLETNMADSFLGDSYVPIKEKVKSTTETSTTEEGPKKVKIGTNHPTDGQSDYIFFKSADNGQDTGTCLPEPYNVAIKDEAKVSLIELPPISFYPASDISFKNEEKLSEVNHFASVFPTSDVSFKDEEKVTMFSDTPFLQNPAPSTTKEGFKEVESSFALPVYLKAAHTAEKENVLSSTEGPSINIKPIKFKNKYNFPDDMISEIERSRPESENIREEEELSKVNFIGMAPLIHPEDKALAIEQYVQKPGNLASEVDPPLGTDLFLGDSYVPIKEKVKSTTETPTTEEGPKKVKIGPNKPVHSESDYIFFRSADSRQVNETDLPAPFSPISSVPFEDEGKVFKLNHPASVLSASNVPMNEETKSFEIDPPPSPPIIDGASPASNESSSDSVLEAVHISLPNPIEPFNAADKLITNRNFNFQDIVSEIQKSSRDSSHQMDYFPSIVPSLDSDFIQHQKEGHVPNSLDPSDGKKRTFEDIIPSVQSFWLPLPNNVRENIIHHVTLAPKAAHTSTLDDYDGRSSQKKDTHIVGSVHAEEHDDDAEEVPRAKAVQDDFRNKQKPESFTTNEDLQTVHQSYLNPCFNPYMSPYVPFMPPTKLGSTQEQGFLKVIGASQPQVQRQPMYVLNPAMYYGVPPTAPPMHSGMVQNPFLQQGFYPPMAPSMTQSPYVGSYNAPVQVASPGGQYYMCNPIPTPTNNIAGISGVEVRRSASNLQSLMKDLQQTENNNGSRAAAIVCPIGEHACMDNTKCVKNHHICNNEINCDDASDEVVCNCKERVGKLRICDGFCDCPHCEDEEGCFGCAEDEFSCDDWSRFRRSTCVPVSQRCDGIKQCEVTGKDELDCSILTDHIDTFPPNQVSNAVGFLHRNYKGKWYPTCFGTEQWAAQVCQIEAGPSAITPKAYMMLTTDPYDGLFINILPNNEISLVNTCVQDRAAFVECPPIYCGLRFLVNNPYRHQEVDTSLEDMLNDLERAYRQEENVLEMRHAERKKRGVELSNAMHEHLDKVINSLEKTFSKREVSTDAVLKQSRVVGGRASQPAAWPWLVSIYKNGIFHCGGVLVNELWVVTASHCVDRFWLYYYEIQAGALRRFSYSPMDQRRWAKVIVPHEFYSKKNLRNDIALMKLSAPVRYNKYVRPICLPSESTAGQDFLKGPKPGTICTTVGWGATIEHGADPDHMREVEVPILEHCKHKEDFDVDEICAGLSQGGKDACQGDSGGPLMCRNPNNPNQWYLAGIVSHGEGCARPDEPGVYTKVSRYMGWIAENTRSDKFSITSPLQKCPGFVCKGTRRCIPKKRRCDRIVDCLLGDDELNCDDRFRDIFKYSRVSPTSSFTQNLPIEEFVLLGEKRNDTAEEIDDEQDNYYLPNNNRNSGMFEDDFFKCTVLLQVISINRRCDKVVDCEDGTDELNCSCADYIKNTDASGVCDGVVDCPDMSDEKDCLACNATEYKCRNAQMCIRSAQRCDGVADCPHNEDEMDCASLTDAQEVNLDSDGKPIFKSRGMVTINYQGEWRPFCLNASSPFENDEPSVATIVCNLLGFNDYVSYQKYPIENRAIEETYSARHSKILDPEKWRKCDHCCDGLHVSCSNVTTDTTLNYNKPLEEVREVYFSPWTAAIYSDGEFKCMGTILNQYWVLTSVNCFIGITVLPGRYVAAVLGKGKLNVPVKGPHEQIIRVVESIKVNTTDIVLLRLESDIKFNRYVQAANLEARRDNAQTEKCLAVGRDNDNRVKFVILPPLKNCPVGFRCFEKKIEDSCKDKYPWSGTIICDSRSGWYPAAVFTEENGHCGFHHEKKYTSVKFYKNQISKIMLLPPNPISLPFCEGVQCDLGNCVSRQEICNGVADCHGGEDEFNDFCYEREMRCHNADDCVCPQSHLKCPSSTKCFSKSSFCDRINNCGELEDEPEICSCKNYLKLTNPDRVCDGILNCMDRSDEDPNFCTCALDDFECGKTNTCVPQDMVCDGVKDCPNGEDEEVCLSLSPENHNGTNAGEVMTRTAGVWHSGCFDVKYSTSQLEEICAKLGFSGASANQLPLPHNSTTSSAIRPVLDTFDVVWLRRSPGNRMKLRIRTGHQPYVRFVPDESCHRLFIACI